VSAAAIFAKELRAYFTSMLAYVVLSIFLVLSGYYFYTNLVFFVLMGGMDLPRGLWQYQFHDTRQILLFVIPFLTMRLFAEEKKLGTIELLMTAPLRDSEVVLGKFFGSVLVVLVMFAFTLYYPLLLVLYGDPDLGPFFSGYLGLLLLAVSSLAVGLFASSVTSNQILSVVVGGGIVLALWFLGAAASLLPAAVGGAVAYFSSANYLSDFVRGIIDLRGIVYYLSITALFLFLAVRALENSRWN
jgi:ABC-2 type transport system permease protein